MFQKTLQKNFRVSIKKNQKSDTVNAVEKKKKRVGWGNNSNHSLVSISHICFLAKPASVSSSSPTYHKTCKSRKHTNKNYPERTWTPKAISNKYYFFGTYLTDYNTKGEIYISPLCNRPHKTLTHWGLQCKGLVTRWIPTGPGRKQTAFQSKTKFLVKAYEIGDYTRTHTHTHAYNNKSTGRPTWLKIKHLTNIQLSFLPSNYLYLYVYIDRYRYI